MANCFAQPDKKELNSLPENIVPTKTKNQHNIKENI